MSEILVCVKCGNIDDSGKTPRTASSICEHEWYSLLDLRGLHQRLKEAETVVNQVVNGMSHSTILLSARVYKINHKKPI